jgi:hypothetical protein
MTAMIMRGASPAARGKQHWRVRWRGGGERSERLGERNFRPQLPRCGVRIRPGPSQSEQDPILVNQADSRLVRPGRGPGRCIRVSWVGVQVFIRLEGLWAHRRAGPGPDLGPDSLAG